MVRRIFLIPIILMFCASNIAIAGRTWINSPIEVGGMPVQGGHCGLAMRSGNTWPVVSYGDPMGNSTAVMTPVGWISGPSVGTPTLGISAATSPSGTVGFAYGNGFVQTLSPAGWATSNYGATSPGSSSFAFNTDSNPGVLHNAGGGGSDLTVAFFNGSGWYQDVVQSASDGPFSSDAFALEYDSYNQANIAFAQGTELMFGVKGVLTQHQWEFDTVKLGASLSFVDMAMGVEDVPWVTYESENLLYYATYDRQQQDWVNGLIGELEGDGYFSMATDSTGGIGVAFVGLDNLLTYAYTDGSGIWTTDSGFANADDNRDVGLAFDADNNPVICYSDMDYGGVLYLAYDPVVPEPASIMLLAIGAAILRRRQRA